ncbi:HAD-IIIA family hydrolase [Aminithiophilus ramosus]|uniref:HAD-IIIA family hydrolase n=2 Tax=Synergistales TaxID=649776 RepID=A0A9Q7AP47_9BACT|nr:HAD-IIIA family hydrolase [Aminithiophilus ramosus]QTX31626.1 HAD-IIIA family hydrolase [Aminithiophilus ramosus]QVL35433.1 HAD-IIIA family hydrolase [Synergistota bacterium]
MAIRLLALDVDGTLTDGGVYLDGAGNEFKRFDIRDGMGLVRLRESGVALALISGRASSSTEARARALGISIVHNGVGEKLPVLKKVAADLGLEASEVAFMGDDVNDLDCLLWAGLSLAPCDARPEVLAAAGWVASLGGGRGAVREAAEKILSLNGERALP